MSPLTDLHSSPRAPRQTHTFTRLPLSLNAAHSHTFASHMITRSLNMDSASSYYTGAGRLMQYDSNGLVSSSHLNRSCTGTTKQPSFVCMLQPSRSHFSSSCLS